MPIVTELLDAYPLDEDVLEIKRDEELLLTKPEMKFAKLTDYKPLQVIHFPTEYVAQAFAPPRGVYESDHLRVEWQQMKGRQPFYHRNADVDELSYQVSGPRTTMTEYGTVEMRPGLFSRIPVGVAHDNYGREAVHLLFYIPAPVLEVVPVYKRGEYLSEPFEGWKSRNIEELMTNCLGGPGPDCDIALSYTDEALLLEKAKGLEESKRLPIVKPSGRANGETEWLYKSKHVWLGFTRHISGSQKDATVYRRHRRAEEIQAQVKGKRTIISQRGILQLEPGDFVNLPFGVAFTEVAGEESEHITILTFNVTPPKAEVAREAEPVSWSAVQALRN